MLNTLKNSQISQTNDTLLNLTKNKGSQKTISAVNKVYSLHLKRQNINKNEILMTSNHFPSSTREWKNSIYLYNKSNLSVIHMIDQKANSVINSYFSLFNKHLEEKLRDYNYLLRFRKKSQNKIFVSNSELKHTNNKVIINLYIFNRQKNNYNIATREIKKFFAEKLKYSTSIISNRLKYIEKKSFKFLQQSFKEKKLYLVKNLHKDAFGIKTSRYIKICTKNFFLRLLKKEYNKTLQYFYYKQMLNINSHKLSYTYLQYLKQHLYKLYNKQIEFNIINQKRFYLNSDIMLESILKKISKKRKKVLIFIKKLRDKVLVSKKKPFLLNFKIEKSPKKTITSIDSKYLVETIKNKLRYKHVTGLKLQAKGRLTKRYTASRSVLKTVYKGNLLDMDSSLKGLSSVLLKGNLKSNLQYTKLASKSRIGSYGLKNWVSSY